MCQFGGHVMDFCNFCNTGLNRCQLPYASLAGKSFGFLQLLQSKVESLSGGQVSWISISFALIQG
jgi:hypothetical protein